MLEDGVQGGREVGWAEVGTLLIGGRWGTGVFLGKQAGT